MTATFTCNVPEQSPLAELIRGARLIVWDEAPMAHRFLLEALDRTLRDVTVTGEPFVFYRSNLYYNFLEESKQVKTSGNVPRY